MNVSNVTDTLMNESCLINPLLREISFQTLRAKIPFQDQWKVFSLKITVVNESLMTGSYEFIVGNKVSYEQRKNGFAVIKYNGQI